MSLCDFGEYLSLWARPARTRKISVSGREPRDERRGAAWWPLDEAQEVRDQRHDVGRDRIEEHESEDAPKEIVHMGNRNSVVSQAGEVQQPAG